MALQNKSIKGMIDAIKEYIDKTGPSQTMTTAKVLSTDGQTAWIKIAGGVEKTPVKKTIDCKKGDTVQICIDNGTAFVVGNASAPPTDDTEAVKASNSARVARVIADEAAQTADDAKSSADDANVKASAAQTTATAAAQAAEAASQASAQNTHDIAMITETAVTDVVIQYAKGTSQSVAPETGWSGDTPEWEEGKYIWQRTVTTIDGEQFVSNTACIQGAAGRPGTPGISITSVTEYYLATSASSGVTRDTPGWTTTIQNITEDKPYLWNYEVSNGSNGSVISTTTPVIIGRYGTDGQPGDPGTPGTPGRGIVSIVEHYQISDSNSTAPTTWSDTVVTTTVAKPYLWNYETISYTSGQPEDTAARVIGTHGTPGTSVTVTGEDRAYQLSTSGTAIPTGSWSPTPQAPTATEYAWTRTIVRFSDGSTATTYTVGGKAGSNGPPGVSPTVTNSVTQYQKSTSGTAVPTGSWSDAPVAPDKDNYVWSKTTVTYSDGTTATIYSVAGKTGATGDTGRGITNITPQYYLSTSSSSAEGGSWATTPPAYVEGRYYWTRSKVEWSSGTSVTYVPSEDGVLDNALTDANNRAYQALRTAGSASDIATATRQHFWTDTDGVHIASEAEVPAATRNVIFNALGALFRRGSKYILAIVTGEQSGTSPGIEIYDGQGNAATNIIAKFTGALARIGKTSASHSEMDKDGQRFYGDDGTTLLANIGYGPGASESGTQHTAPYYSFGPRKANSSIGNYSMMEGYDNTSSGYCGHAEGYNTTAGPGVGAHAEGQNTTAAARGSHAEGYFSTASGGIGAHAEGDHAEANGYATHAQGSYTKASSGSQTAMGKYNVEDANDKFALIVGNGTDTARSNAFAVDWDGHPYVGNDQTTYLGYVKDGVRRTDWTSGNYNLVDSSSRFVMQIKLPPGVWVITYTVRFQQQPGGTRRIGLATTSAGGTNPIGAIMSIPNAANSGQVQLLGTEIQSHATETTYYVHAYQNSGATIGITNASLRAVRVG